jgi:hypothetical protein
LFEALAVIRRKIEAHRVRVNLSELIRITAFPVATESFVGSGNSGHLFRKFWPLRYPDLTRPSALVKLQMQRSDRGPIGSYEATALEDAVNVRLSEIFIMQHAARRLQRLVRGEDHRAMAAMPLKEHVRGIRPVGEIPTSSTTRTARCV